MGDREIVDETTVRLNFPEYFKNPKKLSDEDLVNELGEIWARLGSGSIAVDMMELWHMARKGHLEAELQRRLGERNELQKKLDETKELMLLLKDKLDETKKLLEKLKAEGEDAV